MSTATPLARPRATRPGAARTLLAFFALAYLLTWVFWVPAGLAARGDLVLPVPELVLVIVGGFGPMVAAILVVARTTGRRDLAALVRSLDPRRVRRRWFLVCAALVPLNLTPVAVHLLGGDAAPAGQTLVEALLVFPLHVLFIAVAGGGLDEEVGWRGLALPTLLRRCSPVHAHLVLGVVWAGWHLPLWLDPAGPHALYPFWLYVVKTVALSVLIGWLYSASGGSLAVAVAAHALSNGGDGLRYQLLGEHAAAPSAQLVLAIGLVVAAVAVVVLTRGRVGADARPSPRT